MGSRDFAAARDALNQALAVGQGTLWLRDIDARQRKALQREMESVRGLWRQITQRQTR